MDGASAEAVRLGYEVRRIEAPTLGEARDAAEMFAARIAERGGAGVSLIASGETTVTLPAESTGRGGRNQEFALAAALALESHQVGAHLLASSPPDDLRDGWAFASVGTDGIDGPTDAAGALVDWSSLARASARGLDARSALEAHDSYTFFERLGDLIVTGPTSTNVGDLQVYLGARSDSVARGQV